MTAPKVVLIGPPGAGKSTVGTLVAEQLGVTFRDTDADVEAETGAVIADIFVDQGETAFRRLERAAVRRALTEHPGVLALGGGAVLDADTRRDLCSQHVVFLDVSLADAARRVGLDTSRPLLLGNVRGRLKQLMDARRPLYGEVASVVISTDGREPADIAGEVVRTVRGTGTAGECRS
ncbi:shikimate kinase [Actinopolymorpha singaporensis]|uniref:Shikimate kinase n=1 Tax=Actinopolymorpha singaporensis TaxID=117157 RepID=A0A1H1VK29_9ACTN|nr:shikimate kinase [Actinopolymorpha singaporensis]SDS84626.1 shikimate kinase [Actinopolymorpha singaporensis]